MLHARIEGLGEFQFPSIALLSPKELNIVLRELFGEKGFLIKDEKLVYMLRMYCKDNDIPFSVVGTLILRIWKNNPKIYSVYHLDNKKIFVIKDRILEHFKNKDKKIEEEMEKSVLDMFVSFGLPREEVVRRIAEAIQSAERVENSLLDTLREKLNSIVEERMEESREKTVKEKTAAAKKGKAVEKQISLDFMDIISACKAFLYDKKVNLEYMKEYNKMVAGMLAPTRRELTGKGGSELFPITQVKKMSDEELTERIGGMMARYLKTDKPKGK